MKDNVGTWLMIVLLLAAIFIMVVGVPEPIRAVVNDAKSFPAQQQEYAPVQQQVVQQVAPVQQPDVSAISVPAPVSPQRGDGTGIVQPAFLPGFDKGDTTDGGYFPGPTPPAVNYPESYPDENVQLSGRRGQTCTIYQKENRQNLTGILVYSGPGRNYDALFVVPDGTVLTIVGPDTNNWFPVSIQSYTAWVQGGDCR